jgi:hypothetical protein
LQASDFGWSVVLCRVDKEDKVLQLKLRWLGWRWIYDGPEQWFCFWGGNPHQ